MTPLSYAGITIGIVAALLTVRWVTMRSLARWAMNRNKDLHDLYLGSLRLPSIFWALAIGIYEGIQLSGATGRFALDADKVIYVLLLASITLAGANLLTRLLRHYVQKKALPIPTTGLTYDLVKGVVIAVGVLVILHSLGISIVPLLTALGVGGLAVALALQDTLSNLFAGIQILLEKPIRVGDFIKLDSGQEGVVRDIGLRTTRLLLPQADVLVIPNNKITQTIITNYSMPEEGTMIVIPVSVSYDSDLDHVEMVLTGIAARATQEVDGVLAAPAPSVSYTAFGPSSIDCSLSLKISDVTKRQSASHTIRKMIFNQFREESIEIPMPHTTVSIKQGQGGKTDL
ncbi:MAG: mechanosensitive ion channel family protein [Actinomycetota bacterium]|nr:mechanosensitive ion channel family protein [Actinomycetota bacterium]